MLCSWGLESDVRKDVPMMVQGAGSTSSQIKLKIILLMSLLYSPKHHEVLPHRTVLTSLTIPSWLVAPW